MQRLFLHRQYVKEIMFCLIEAPVLNKYFNWTSGIKDEKLGYPDFQDIQLSMMADEKGVCGDDFDVLKLVYSILNQQAFETLKLKYESREKSPESWREDFLPNDLAYADCMDWAREPEWNELQAVLLSVGICPKMMIESDFDELEQKIPFSMIAYNLFEEVRRRRRLVKKYSYGRELQEGDPLAYIEWLQRMQFSIPNGLANAVYSIHSPSKLANSDDVSISGLERESLLKLVAGMSIKGYRFDPSAKRNDATRDIQSDLDQLGIGMDSKTVLKWLREASLIIDREDKS